MGQGSDRRAVVAILGCATLIFLTLLVSIAFVGGIAITRIRAAAPTPTAARAAAPNLLPTPTPILTTPTGVAFATRPRPALSPVAPGGTPVAAPVLLAIDLPINDLVYDPFSRQLWASVPGRSAQRGNSVVPINPQSGAIGQPIFVGSEPTRLALSDDGRYLYVALDGAAAVRRVDLAAHKADLEIALGEDRYQQTTYPAAIAVLPGKPEAVAVVRSDESSKYRSRGGDVAIFVEGQKLPAVVESFDGDTIGFCDSAATLYAFGNLSSGYHFLRIDVDSAGARRRDSTDGVISGPNVTIHCDAGRIYASSGQVVDVATRRLVGTFPGLSSRTLVHPDSTVGQVFFLTEADSAVSTQRGYRLLAFDQGTFRQRWALDIAEPTSKGPPSGDTDDQPGALVRWGADGLAFRANAEQVYLLRAPGIGGAQTTATPPASNSPTPAPLRPTPVPQQTPPRATTAATSASRFPPALGQPSARLSAVSTLSGHGDTIRAVAWSPDGTILASGSSDKTVRLWRADGTHMATLVGHTDPVYFLDWTRDGSRLATAALGNDPIVRLWEPSGKPLATIRAHQSTIQGIFWSPDGKLLATLGDRTVKLWRDDGTPVASIGGQRFAISRVAWSPDSTALAFAPGDSSVQIWNIAGELVATFEGHQQPTVPRQVVWSPDGTRLASGDGSGSVFLWQRDGREIAVLERLNGPVVDLAWSPDSSTVASISSTGELRQARIDGTARYGSETKEPINVNARLAWSPDGTRLALNVPGRFIVLFAVDTNQFVSPSEPYPNIDCFALSPDGKTIATGTTEGTVQLWR